MKLRFLHLIILVACLTIGTLFGFTVEKKGTCPLAGTPGCPEFLNCPKQGQPDCPILLNCPKQGQPDCPILLNCPKYGQPDCPYRDGKASCCAKRN